MIGARKRGGLVELRVYAPEHARVEVVRFERHGDGAATGEPMFLRVDDARSGGPTPLVRDESGHFSGTIPWTAGLLYELLVDGEGPYPDPASRAQPFGVHGPSAVIDDEDDEDDALDGGGGDARFPGVGLSELVVYEAHVGAATRRGTFDALGDRLPAIRDLGATAVELMPVASFPGARNWGYDGVSLFAPQEGYGGRAGLLRFIHRAHRLGLGVILDVVYNHLGPDGNYLRSYSRRYFTDERRTPWGDALDYRDPGLREFVVENAAMWIGELGADGLRLDATHAIADEREPHILREIADAARRAAPDRRVLVIAEDDRNERRLLLPAGEDGLGLDALWADDFHHQLRAALTPDERARGYLRDYAGATSDLAATVARRWFYQGQPSRHFGRPRGTSSAGIAPERCVYCIQNHDQVGNRPFGDRLGRRVSPAAYRAASALLLLCPETPLIFMGQEWNASAPFLYFTDHQGALGAAVSAGRRAEFAFTFQEDFSRSSTVNQVPDPQAIETFERSVLDWDERGQAEHAGTLALYRALLRLRAEHPAMRGEARSRCAVVALGDGALSLSYPFEERPLVVIVNLRGTLAYSPPAGIAWKLVLHSDEKRFGGSGSAVVDSGDGVIRIEGAAAVVMEGVSR